MVLGLGQYKDRHILTNDEYSSNEALHIAYFRCHSAHVNNVNWVPLFRGRLLRTSFDE
jgi:hypothetical protein